MTDFDLMITFAFRYCLGRMTYAPTTFVTYISQKDIWDKISPFTKQTIAKEIRDAQNKKALGHSCDESLWLDLATKLEKE